MPLFDFKCGCEKGSEARDVILKMNHTTADYPVCAECGTPMEKQYSKATAVFKGRGFHCNDYYAPTRGF